MVVSNIQRCQRRAGLDRRRIYKVNLFITRTARLEQACRLVVSLFRNSR